jgi:hypothetical protein
MPGQQKQFVYDNRYYQDIKNIHNAQAVRQIPSHVPYRYPETAHCCTSHDGHYTRKSAFMKEVNPIY